MVVKMCLHCSVKMMLSVCVCCVGVQALYEQSLHIKSAIPHPLIMGVIRGLFQKPASVVNNMSCFCCFCFLH